MPTKKFVLKRKYKTYTDPYAKDWYNSIFSISGFEKGRIEDAQFRGGNRLAEKERLELKQAALDAADYVESMYRHHLRKYKSERDSIENNPNFIGPPSPKRFISDNIRTALQFSNYDGSLFGPYNDNYPDMPSDYEKYKNAKKLGGNIRRKAALGDYEYTLAPTTVYGQGRKLPNLSQYNRVIGTPITPILNMSIPDTPIEVPEFESLNTDVNAPSIALPKINDNIEIPDIPIETPNFKPLNTKVKRVKAIKPTMLENYGLNTGDLVASGIQLAGNIGSSLVNNAMVNRLKFTPMHTMTVAEAPVKFNTTYNINPQLDELRETEEANEREIRDNTASSRNALGRIIGSRLRANRGFNELYGAKLNQESAMLNADAQNRQGVNSRNAQRLQQNISRDTLYNLQGQDAIDNLKSQLKGQIWSNAINQATDSLVGVYNRGQQRISDANSLGYLYASNPDAAKLFMNRNSLIDRIFRYTRKAQGIG